MVTTVFAAVEMTEVETPHPPKDATRSRRSALATHEREAFLSELSIAYDTLQNVRPPVGRDDGLSLDQSVREMKASAHGTAAFAAKPGGEFLRAAGQAAAYFVKMKNAPREISAKPTPCLQRSGSPR